MELPLRSGFLDNLLLTPTGNLVVVECKLWRNFDARRKVFAQITVAGSVERREPEFEFQPILDRLDFHCNGAAEIPRLVGRHSPAVPNSRTNLCSASSSLATAAPAVPTIIASTNPTARRIGSPSTGKPVATASRDKSEFTAPMP